MRPDLYSLQTALMAIRNILLKHEAVYAFVPTQIDGARFCRALLSEIESIVGDSSPTEKPVTLEVAAAESDYSVGHLRRLIHSGALTSYREEGERKHLVLLSDLPNRVRGSRSAAKRTTDASGSPAVEAPTSTLIATPPAESDNRMATAPVEPSRGLVPLPEAEYDPDADARSVLARVRGGKV